MFSTLVENPQICHTYPIKIGTVMPYLEQNKKYINHMTRLEFYWYQHFFTKTQEILLYQDVQVGRDCILIHSF